VQVYFFGEFYLAAARTFRCKQRHVRHSSTCPTIASVDVLAEIVSDQAKATVVDTELEAR
jgi:hypothetical protein